MRIAAYFNVPSGGAKRTFYEMIKGLAPRHTVDVYTVGPANHSFADVRPLVARYAVFDFKPGRWLSSPFGRLNNLIRFIDLVRFRHVQRLMAKTINDRQYDAALIHTDQFINSPDVLRFLKIPTVYYCHDPLRVIYDPPIARPYLRSNRWQRRLDSVDPLIRLYRTALKRSDRANLRSASIVLVNSYFSRESVYRLYDIDARVCYYGINTDTLQPFQAGRDSYVFSVGSVTAAKGFDFVIRSLALIPEERRPRLLIAGNFEVAAERKYLERLALQNRVQVEFTRVFDDQQLAQLYARASLTAYAPVLEPFGLVPLESMACGTPVVAVAEGGVRESVEDGVTGLLTDRDPHAFARAMLSCLEQPEFTARLGANGVHCVHTKWTWDVSLARLESFLQAAAQPTSA
jgi:glycosyltransferase involved in cell wall biosynthesis